MRLTYKEIGVNKSEFAATTKFLSLHSFYLFISWGLGGPKALLDVNEVVGDAHEAGIHDYIVPELQENQQTGIEEVKEFFQWRKLSNKDLIQIWVLVSPIWGLKGLYA